MWKSKSRKNPVDNSKQEKQYIQKESLRVLSKDLTLQIKILEKHYKCLQSNESSKKNLSINSQHQNLLLFSSLDFFKLLLFPNINYLEFFLTKLDFIETLRLILTIFVLVNQTTMSATTLIRIVSLLTLGFGFFYYFAPVQALEAYIGPNHKFDANHISLIQVIG